MGLQASTVLQLDQPHYTICLLAIMSKPALKAAKAAKACLDGKDWSGAEARSREAISYDPQNYYAYESPGLLLFAINGCFWF